MNKRELVVQVADKVGIAQKNARDVVNAVTDAIKKALSKGERVTLVDFGTFQVLNRKARRGRNPQTGERIQISAKKVPKFKAGKKLREMIG